MEPKPISCVEGFVKLFSISRLEGEKLYMLPHPELAAYIIAHEVPLAVSRILIHVDEAQNNQQLDPEGIYVNYHRGKQMPKHAGSSEKNDGRNI